MTLSQFIAPRGALTAAASHLGVAPSTVLRWHRGDWTPSNASKSRLDLMLQTLVFDQNAKKLTPRFSEVKTMRKSHKRNFAAK